MWYIGTVEYYPAIKNENLAIAETWMKLKDIVLCGNKPGTKRQILHGLTYM
jgi:hypothetical protein